MAFFEQAAKFLGFAAEKGAATTVASKVISEAAMAFEVSGPSWERSIKMTQEGKFAGHLGFKMDPTGHAQIFGTVVGEEFRGKKLGIQMYQQAIEEAQKAGALSISSDPTHITESASHVWEALSRRGHNVEKFEYRPGYKGYRINLAEAAANKAKKAITIEHATEVSKAAIHSGTGNDNSTMLKRNLNSTSGSRRTSSAL
jgi:ribosomal protein S18 acetylase RimI-like enzyme